MAQNTKLCRVVGLLFIWKLKVVMLMGWGHIILCLIIIIPPKKKNTFTIFLFGKRHCGKRPHLFRYSFHLLYEVKNDFDTIHEGMKVSDSIKAVFHFIGFEWPTHKMSECGRLCGVKSIARSQR